MTPSNFLGRAGRGLAVAAAIVAAVGVTTASRPAHALGWPAAVGIGVGAAAVGTALGAAANPYGYPGYYPPAYYYPQAAPGYYPGYAPRSCWDPYYRRYYAC